MDQRFCIAPPPPCPALNTHTHTHARLNGKETGKLLKKEKRHIEHQSLTINNVTINLSSGWNYSRAARPRMDGSQMDVQPQPPTLPWAFSSHSQVLGPPTADHTGSGAQWPTTHLFIVLFTAGLTGIPSAFLPSLSWPLTPVFLHLWHWIISENWRDGARRPETLARHQTRSTEQAEAMLTSVNSLFSFKLGKYLSSRWIHLTWKSCSGSVWGLHWIENIVASMALQIRFHELLVTWIQAWRGWKS